MQHTHDTEEELRKKSEHEAKIVLKIKLLVSKLDLEHLKMSKRDWEENLSFRQSTAIIASNPTMLMQKIELETLLLKNLGSLIDFAEGEKELASMKEKHRTESHFLNSIDKVLGL